MSIELIRKVKVFLIMEYIYYIHLLRIYASKVILLFHAFNGFFTFCFWNDSSHEKAYKWCFTLLKLHYFAILSGKLNFVVAKIKCYLKLLKISKMKFSFSLYGIRILVSYNEYFILMLKVDCPLNCQKFSKNS